MRCSGNIPTRVHVGIAQEMGTEPTKCFWAFTLGLLLLIPVSKDLGRQAGGFVVVSETAA